VSTQVTEPAREIAPRNVGNAMFRSVALALGFVVLVAVVNVLTAGHFLTAGNLTNVLRQITFNAIVAVGQTFVIITAGIDLSVGSLIELTGVVMAQFANASHLNGAAVVRSPWCA
jgi:ribose transport system permease protein